MNGSRSEYYPPRASWWSPLHLMWLSAGRFFSLHWAHISISPFQILPSLLIPGYAFRLSKWPWLGIVFIATFVASLFVYFVWLGFGIATFAFALMFGIHASSMAYLFKFLIPYRSVALRVGAALAFILLLAGLIYVPFQKRLARFVMPMDFKGEIVVTQRFAIEPLHHGDWVAFQIKSASAQGIFIRNGFAIERVLAVPADVVRFDKNTFAVNGKTFPRLDHMPVSGERMVTEKQWFVWPTFDINVAGQRVAASEITRVIEANAFVTQETLIGKPFTRWFWRKQMNHEPLPKS